jgi:hypothetical protein
MASNYEIMTEYSFVKLRKDELMASLELLPANLNVRPETNGKHRI